MQNLKQPMIRLLAVILSAVLGGLFILGEPASATTSYQPARIVTIFDLKPNTGYKIIKTNCDGDTVYATFTFNDDLFPDQKFEEIYPIQNSWELHFNTPDFNSGTVTLKNETGKSTCEFNLVEQTLELFSGLKTQEEFYARQPPSGHFVIAKDYYAVTSKLEDECTDEDLDNRFVNGQCYERLGSLTSITGDNFPALGGVVVAQIIIKPNAIRAPHWHLQFAEAGYCYQGIGQVGIIVPSKTIPKSANSQDFYEEKIVEEIFLKENEVFLFPEGSQHYLRNIGNDDFKCALFFTEDTPLNGDQLLTISLQNIVGNTPVGVLNPVLVAEGEDENSKINKISDSPAQTFSSSAQGPEVIQVVEACSGEEPNINNSGCQKSGQTPQFQFGFSPYSKFEP
ncbi:cupin domain-containing protein [Okeania sp. SIO2B3]|uniref:cupin domain-containing protein n=1 Tax=Okeania sp. SIO2B3 TaxID=2607784 RepID=UPI0013BF38EC|nr:cupin domain-containing protein [Okeania sp. SIO2B3]NET46341.1 cupin domain-containing protein [Okeania sp. SIO2B3]